MTKQLTDQNITYLENLADLMATSQEGQSSFVYVRNITTRESFRLKTDELRNVKRWSARKYYHDPTIVIYGDQLYILKSTTTLPFTSTNFATELAAGTWVGIQIGVQDHNSLSGLEYAGTGVIWGHINNLSQTIFGEKLFDGAIGMAQLTSDPSNPLTGSQKIFMRDDGKFYRLDSSGVKTEVGGGGSSDLNYTPLTFANTGQTILPGKSYSIDASGGGILLTLSPTPTQGKRYLLYIDYASDIKAITINGGGPDIEGVSSYIFGASKSSHFYDIIYNSEVGEYKVRRLDWDIRDKESWFEEVFCGALSPDFAPISKDVDFKISAKTDTGGISTILTSAGDAYTLGSTVTSNDYLKVYGDTLLMRTFLTVEKA